MLGEFIEGADLAFMDSTFTPADYSDKLEFGHADWQTSCKIGRNARVGALGLVHHSPPRQDADLRATERAAQSILPSYALRQGDREDLSAIGATRNPPLSGKRDSSAT